MGRIVLVLQKRKRLPSRGYRKIQSYILAQEEREKEERQTDRDRKRERGRQKELRCE